MEVMCSYNVGLHLIPQRVSMFMFEERKLCNLKARRSALVKFNSHSVILHDDEEFTDELLLDVDPKNC